MAPTGISDGTSVESRPSEERPPAGPGQPPVGSDDAPAGESPHELAGHDFMAWRLGEQAALERLVRRATPMLWHLARAYRLDGAAAEDVVQATWLALIRQADSIRDGAAVLTWLSVTARREAWRVSNATRREDSFEPDVLYASVPPTAGVDGTVIADAEARHLWRLVARLPERCRRLLRTVAFDDHPDYRTIAADMDMPHGSIGPTRRRCLDKLRKLLADDIERSE
jgi:RNA polymerase sigma factor (sigma-70 family)